ncbi:alpha-keto acid decarboxylase family protein [Micromonospora krabiensis]|uniref:Alpha-keto-acid decarboxylase n=1 Tax=Micromonospora krabiensis TaxID=307121 RepID=A0A1C3N328_9ACTN|nr:thiamine pyrophosphate-binding protein [Micromonospora krabiensis]SBV27002.1 indolepyruvate decarboxylase [Micromonospora krabiensis]
MAGGDGTTAVGELLLSRLRDLGVRHIFGLPGDYNMDFLDQVEAFDGIEWVGSCNELNAGYSADGYARLNGVAAILTTFGPGELSAVSALAGAMAESVPIVSIVGGPTVEIMRQHTSMHHSLADGDFEHWVRVAREVTVAQTTLTTENAPDEIDRVLAECWSQQRPVYVRLPGDVVRARVARPARRFTRPDPVAAPAQLDAFATAAQRLLAGAARPAMLVGNLPIRYDLGPAVAALAAERNWPVAAHALGRGLLDESDPHYVGIYNGGDGEDPAREVVEGADVLVCVGTTFFDWDGLFTADLAPERIINLQRDSAVVAGTRFAPVAMSAALRCLQQIAPNRGAGWSRNPSLLAEPPQLDPSSDEPLRQVRLWPAVQAMLREGDILVPETGTPSFGAEAMRLPDRTAVLAAPIWGAIGYATPAAFGAQVAAPDRRVVLVTGDGSLQLTVQEISRMLALGQRPIIIVVNNGGYTVERSIDGPHQPYNDIDNWRYAGLPQAFARDTPFTAHVARTEGELARALAGLDGTPDHLTLIEVVTDPRDLPIGMPQWGRETSAADYHAKLPTTPKLPVGGLP